MASVDISYIEYVETFEQLFVYAARAIALANPGATYTQRAGDANPSPVSEMTIFRDGDGVTRAFISVAIPLVSGWESYSFSKLYEVVAEISSAMPPSDYYDSSGS